MIETLFHAYTPLVVWTGLGMLLFRFIPANFPKLLGRGLYLVGVPLQLLVLARQTEFSGASGLSPAVAVGELLLSMTLGWLSWQVLQWLTSQKATEPSVLNQNSLFNFSSLNFNSLDRSTQGSFILASMLGNTGFIGLAIAPAMVSGEHMSWAVLYSVTSNLIGNYGIAVFIASYFSNSPTKNHWWIHVRDVLTVPCLWGFVIGLLSRPLTLPVMIESALQGAVWVVIACALVLVGIRLSSIQGWQSFKLALIPSLLKVVIVPMLVGLGANYLQLTGESPLVLVVMSGTPTALAVLILAEVYDLNRDLLACSIAMTFVGLLLVLPLWLVWFG